MTRLLIKLLDYPDKLESALIRCKWHKASGWDVWRMRIAKKIWEGKK